jgi:hypothetical protein
MNCSENSPFESRYGSVIIDILFCAWFLLFSCLFYYFVIISYQYCFEHIPSVVRIIQIDELFAIDKLSYWDIVRIIRRVYYSSFLPGTEFERENWELNNETGIFKI